MCVQNECYNLELGRSRLCAKDGNVGCGAQRDLHHEKPQTARAQCEYIPSRWDESGNHTHSQRAHT